MTEFLVVFVVTFLFIIGVTAALAFGKVPVYSPDVDQIQGLLTRLLEDQLPEQEWHFFLDMPIQHDPELEAIRLKCIDINETNKLRSRNVHARLKEPGIIRIRHLLNKLEYDGSRSF